MSLCRQVDPNLVAPAEQAGPAAPSEPFQRTQFFTRITDALTKRWLQILLVSMALGPFLNFVSSLQTILHATTTGGPRGRFFRLTPLSVEDAFIAGGPPPKLRGTSMRVTKLQVLHGSGVRGEWTAAEGAGNATMDRDYRGAAVIDLARSATADGFVCLVERVEEGAPPPRFRLETSIDGDSFNGVSIPPWTSIRVEPRDVWDEAVGGGKVIWDLQPSWGWVLDFVVVQGASAVLLGAGAVLGAFGHGRKGAQVLAMMCVLRAAAYIFVLITASDAVRTVVWGDAKSIATFYVPRLAVYAPLAFIIAWDGPGALEASLGSIAMLNGVYFLQRKHDGGEHGRVVLWMTCLVSSLGLVFTLARGAQLMSCPARRQRG